MRESSPRLADARARGAVVARATLLDPAFDLLAAYTRHDGFLFERAGVGVAAGGEMLHEETVPTADAQGIRALGASVLGLLRSLNSSGTLPVAVGALPFDPQQSATVLIPAACVRRTDRGETWLLRFADREGATGDFLPHRIGRSHSSEAFSPMQILEHPEAEAYERAVASALEGIRDGEVAKVVLARTIEVAAGRRLDPRTLAQRLRAVDPSAITFAAPVSAAASLVGASPELLVSRRGRRVRSTPLAGSSPRSGDPDIDRAHASRLLASEKDREEHAIVVDSVAETLEPFCERLSRDPEPVVLETANVWHLATRFVGWLREPVPSALDLVAALHPTPAVCGAPRGKALELIRALEPFERGLYAGPVGWIDADGDGDWAIALRCARLSGDRATLYAGAGIVGGSDPRSELEETEQKFRAFLDSLRWS